MDGTAGAQQDTAHGAEDTGREKDVDSAGVISNATDSDASRVGRGDDVPDVRGSDERQDQSPVDVIAQAADDFDETDNSTAAIPTTGWNLEMCGSKGKDGSTDRRGKYYQWRRRLPNGKRESRWGGYSDALSEERKAEYRQRVALREQRREAQQAQQGNATGAHDHHATVDAQ